MGNAKYLSKIEIPATYNGMAVTEIEEEGFISKTLKEITIPDSVTSIGNSAFNGCTSLTSVTIGNGVTSIGEYAFGGCASLTSVTIPDNVTSIGEYAFAGCAALTIHCEAESIPDGWSSAWNSSNRPVVWGYKGEN